MADKIKPALVMALICGIVCALLIAANQMTKDKIAVAQQESLNKSISELFTDEKFTAVDMDIENITSISKGDKGDVAFEITVSGYSKDGLQLIIGVDAEGKLAGISVVTIKETPGLGTKAAQPSFLDKFKGITSSDYDIDNITGATYSSKGIKNAVNIVMDAYNEYKEEILSE